MYIFVTHTISMNLFKQKNKGYEFILVVPSEFSLYFFSAIQIKVFREIWTRLRG